MAYIDAIKARAKADKKTIVLPESMDKRTFEAAEKIQHEYSQIFGWIELNTWCPSNTVMKVGWWSDMLRDKEKTLKIIQRLSEISGNLPFSLKSRAWLNESDKDEQMEFLIEASKYCDKISIHGRTLKQLYSGDADWNFISKLKERIWSTKCKIIGNWWIISYSDAKEKIQSYGLDGIMIGQAAIWNPWIFTDYEPTINENDFASTYKNNADAIGTFPYVSIINKNTYPIMQNSIVLKIIFFMLTLYYLYKLSNFESRKQSSKILLKEIFEFIFFVIA